MNILSENYRRYRKVKRAWSLLWRVRKAKAKIQAEIRELEQQEKMLNEFISSNNDLKIIPPTENLNR